MDANGITLSSGYIIGIIGAALLGGMVTWLIYSLRRIAVLKNETDTMQQQLRENKQKHTKLFSEFTELQKIFDNNILHDGITGLPSRVVFEDRLQQTVNESRRYQFMFAVLFLDIDDFKVINDVLGHEIGDTLLKEVGARLKSCIRQVDTICRYAGDEFVFILPKLAKGEAAAYVAQRFLDAISQPFIIDQNELFITSSIGISVYPTDGETGKTLLKKADASLHQAKSRGQNIYQFYRQEMSALGRRDLLLNSHLRNDNVYQELVIHYQPLVNIQSRKIISMEAMLRWQHPDFGLITPDEFLHLAESNGRILPIGDWLIFHACKQFNAWQTEGLNLQSIAVNVSLRQLENPHFVHKLSQILQETEVEPQSLVLEISEAVLLPKLELVEKNLNMLHRLGVLLLIDNFGIGYLSLQHLRSFPVNYLKIDGSLIKDIAVNKESEAIAKMISVLAESLQLTLVADAVENTNQKELLRQMGCYIMQGHLFSYPRLSHEFTDLVLHDISEHA
jgi:diguanylate cyclase (GGDEF)-like protein